MTAEILSNGEIFPGFYGAIFGAIIGALLAFFFTRYSLQKEQRKKIEKIHNILSDEFYRIYRYADDAKEYLTSQLESEKEFDEHFGWTEHEVIRARSPVIFGLPNFRFLLWDAIISSGSLINLESNEIQLINSAHDDMVIFFKRLEKTVDDFDEKFRILDEKMVLKKKINKIKKEDLRMFLMFVYADLVQIQQIFEKLEKNISWIKKEFYIENPSTPENDFYDMYQPTFISIPVPKPTDSIKKTPV